MDPYRITLADDHVLLRQGLRRIIENNEGMEVVGEAGDGLELIRLVDETAPDLVILDISMPNLRGTEAIGEIKRRHPGVKALVLTMHRDEEYLQQALSSGADGYLLKEDSDTDLFFAITKIRQGGLYLSPSLAHTMVEYWNRNGQGAAKSPVPSESLTTREREVLRLVAEGKSSPQIAGLLSISIRTVDQHRANIKNKLRLRKTADLVKYAISQGYIQVLVNT